MNGELCFRKNANLRIEIVDLKVEKKPPKFFERNYAVVNSNFIEANRLITQKI